MVAKEVVATYAAASSGFRKVVGVTTEVQYHVTGDVADGGVGVGHRIIEEPYGGVTVLFLLLLIVGYQWRQWQQA